jgi:V/A-type H+/Na+-transporting ATPase subunit F
VPVPARNLLVATRPGDGSGFRLAGVPVAEVAPGEEAARLRAWVADPSVGVVAVESRVLDAMPEGMLRRAQSLPFPVLLPFTLPRGAEQAGGRAYVAALIRRAIGYHVKLEDRR